MPNISQGFDSSIWDVPGKLAIVLIMCFLFGCTSGTEPEKWSGGGDMGSRHRDSSALLVNFEYNEFRESNLSSIHESDFDFLFIPKFDSVFVQKATGAKYGWSSEPYENVSVSFAVDALEDEGKINTINQNQNTFLFMTTSGYIGKAKVIEREANFIRLPYVLHKTSH